MLATIDDGCLQTPLNTCSLRSSQIDQATRVTMKSNAFRGARATRFLTFNHHDVKPCGSTDVSACQPKQFKIWNHTSLVKMHATVK
jgi:hypothetical protein